MRLTVDRSIRFSSILFLLTGFALAEPGRLTVTFSEAKGIGEEEGVMRRDPSDIILADGFYHVWYSKGHFSHGYDASVWHAKSRDGRIWTETGEAVARGPFGSWDEQSAFTPNILVAEGKYWLFYTGVSKPFVGSGPGLTKTAIGVAVSKSPDGPWERLGPEPVLKPSGDESLFDGVRVDDSSFLIRRGKYFCYFKGRQSIQTTPHETRMGLAVADRPQGPYVRVQPDPVIPGGHEVMVWPKGGGVVAMISDHGPQEFRKRLFYSDDGIRFQPTHTIPSVPSAPGAFRPEAFTGSGSGTTPEWGIHTRTPKKGLPYLERFECKVDAP